MQGEGHGNQIHLLCEARTFAAARQTVTIEIEGDTLTYDTFHEAEQKFLARFQGEERENKLIEWKSGPIEDDGRYSEYRAHLPLSE